ncbi:MAG: terminase family protein [Acidobacteria bacterium]|nr:terminase family protein [Acidobacteriota bacterium]
MMFLVHQELMQQVKVPDYTASERQSVFHQAVADEKLYGGAAGGGKTAAIVAESVTLALEYPGIPVNLFRRTIPELNKTIKAELVKQCHAYMKAGHLIWHGQSNGEYEGRSYVFDNGSCITLNYLDNESDMYRYQGAEMPVIGVDELTQFPLAWIEYLITRNRTSNPDWPVLFMSGTNPGGIGHGWVKNRFIDAAPPEKVFEVRLPDGETKTRVFIPAKLDDHPDERFRRDYNKQLQSISDPSLRRALRFGDWDVFAGQVFTEFSRHLHVVEPFFIPNHWRKWRSMDYGNKNSVLWYAQDPASERTYVYREYRTENYVPISGKSQTINDLEAGESIAYGLADPSIWNGSANHNDKEGKTIAQMFDDEGVQWQPAINDRVAGLAMVHHMLGIADNGLPRLQIFSSCVSLIKTLPSLPYDKHRTDDVDTEADDHDYDSLRYGVMKFRTNGKPTIKQAAWVQRVKQRNGRIT